MQYVADYYFVYPISDVWEAQDCLNNFSPVLPDKVQKFEIEVHDEQGGKILLTTSEQLAESEQEEISSTLKEEFFYGFGTIFESQPFASRFKVGFVEGALFPEEDFEVASIRSRNNFKLREIKQKR